MNAANEIKRLNRGIKALELIEYHETQYDCFVWNYEYEFQERPELVKHYKHMAQCEQRCIDRLKSVYLAMGLSKNYGKH